MHGGKVSERLFDQGLCLPSGAGLSEEERGRVITAFTKAFARQGRDGSPNRPFGQ
jgi:dTDP-4-amino-4,6-dideoxygalactose transaminase